ncbi:conserved hypothetical protein [Carnobacterium maltaromaticum]|nr:conserved hypothetical protein [Carnobacterium maltaromaticum]CAD5899469.1 conserved hypothetical protein [Carnobacterium maltaromaticum]
MKIGDKYCKMINRWIISGITYPQNEKGVVDETNIRVFRTYRRSA